MGPTLRKSPRWMDDGIVISPGVCKYVLFVHVLEYLYGMYPSLCPPNVERYSLAQFGASNHIADSLSRSLSFARLLSLRLSLNLVAKFSLA